MSAADPAGHLTRLHYDRFGRLTEYRHDALGQVTAVAGNPPRHPCRVADRAAGRAGT
ncbi:RHS repeat protein [Cronobacter dublinensis]|nr:RHS repeat protein [Cronobacter dublinensis]